MPLNVYLFGDFRVTVDEQPVMGFRSEKARALLAYLAVEGRIPVRRTLLAELLWSGYTAESARTNLRVTLSNLNQLFAAHPLLAVTYHTVQFIGKAPVCWSDLEQAEELLARAETLPPNDQTLLHKLLRLPFLAGLEEIDSAPFVAWLQARRAHYQRAMPPAVTRPAPPPLLHLPAPVNQLIGRETDLAAVGALLAKPHVRLVTLVGPPGVGKSRLALTVAAQAQPAFAQGAVFVSLAAVQEPEEVATVICHTLGLQLTGTQPVLAQLRHYLREQQLLLLLDNFEQIVAAGPLISTLLAAAPGLKVLVTSRTILHLSGEWKYVVAPLATALTNGVTAPAAVAPAVALFVERAQALHPAFRLTAANQAAVTMLCQRLDGLPLAIELVAARSRIFSPQALVERLDHSAPAVLQLLSYGAHDLPARHRTLMATMQWSYALLAAAEQRVLTQLALFVGGFSLAAAQAFCDATAEQLELLLQASLLQTREQPDGSQRFFMLETVRFFALAQWDEAAVAVLRQQHGIYFAHWACTQCDHLHGPGQLVALAALRQEHDNWQAALTWAEAHALPLALQLATTLSQFWRLADNPAEGLEWLQRLTAASVSLAAVPPLTYAYARLAAFELAQLCGQPLPPYLAEQAHLAALCTAAQDERALGRLAWLVGRATLEHLYLPDEGSVGERYAKAGAALQQALNQLQATQDAIYLPYVYYDLGNFHVLLGNAAAGLAAYQAGLQLTQARGDSLVTGQLTAGLAFYAYIVGDFVAAVAHCEAALAVFQAARSLHNWLTALAILAVTCVEQEDLRRAETVLTTGQALLKQAPDHFIEGIFLYATAMLAERQRHFPVAVALYGQSFWVTASAGSFFAFPIFFALCELLTTLQQAQILRVGWQIWQTWLASVGGRLPTRWQRRHEQMCSVLTERWGPAGFAAVAPLASEAEIGPALADWLHVVLAGELVV